MKHRVYGKHLGRNKDERERLFKSLIQSLFLHGSIKTSSEKAKAVKGLVDKVINLAKDKTRNHLLQSYVANDQLQVRLIKEIAPKMATRTSGYTSLIRLGQRLGDNAMMVRMSLIGMEELKPLEKVTGNSRQRRASPKAGQQVTVKKTEETKKVTPKKKVVRKSLPLKRKRISKK